MRVLKRDGTYQDVDLNKITLRISKLRDEITNGNPKEVIDPVVISQKVCASLHDGINTSELDTLASEIAISMGTLTPEYASLAAFIVVSDLQKEVSKHAPTFSESMQKLNDYGFLHHELNTIIQENSAKLNSSIVHQRDYIFDYFAMKTLIKGYLQKIKKQVIETPQYMWLRVSLGIHKDDIDSAIETYNYMSQKYFTHATPTLFNSGSQRPQLASCFLLAMQDDSIKGIYNTLSDCAQISKWAGGIGLHIHNVRSHGSTINNVSNVGTGIVPMLKVFNDTARYVNQCFTGDTMVYTKRGAVRIDNITTNDQVITKDGSFKKVMNIFSHNVSKEILEIKTQSSFESIKVTKEHHLYVIKRPYKGLNYSELKKRLESKIIQPEFIEASSLKGSYLVGFPKQSFNNNTDPFSQDYYRIIGILIGDGSISRKEVNFHLNNTTKTLTVDFVKSFLSAHNIHYWVHVNDKSVTVSCSLSNFKNLKYSTIYTNEKEKYINPNFFNLTMSNTLQLFKGMLETDGNFYKEITYSTTSYQLAHDLKQLLLKFGAGCSGYQINNIGQTHEIRPGEYITHRKISYIIRIPRLEIFKEIIENNDYTSSHHFKCFEYNGMIWSGIKSITPIEYSGPVYDLEVSENHNYTIASFGLVHNSGKRPGSIAIYLQVDHPDIFSFLDLRKNTGDEEERARDLFYAIWVPDLFMEKVKTKGSWCLFNPHKCPGLSDVYGEEYKNLYEKYENEGLYDSKIYAQDLWAAICNAQIETGTPYILYKDACNQKSNQQNLGPIKSSNLCTEILEYTDKDEVAVCNLASICLPQFVNTQSCNSFDHKKLHEITKVITRNLNKVIDISFYPIPQAELSNKRHRPIGIGVQGLADVYQLLGLPFDSDEAAQINNDIFETIYHAAMTASMELAKIYGPYETFKGSPLSKGKFQFDLWNESPGSNYDWEELRSEVMKYGVYNSLLLAPMPTATTSQIMGNNEAIEPYTSNLYLRRTVAGEFVVINKHLVKDLQNRDLWNEKMKDRIIYNEGSIQNIPEIPQFLKQIYKTAWELSQKVLINQAADRGKYVCQSQSLNLFVPRPNLKILSSMHFYSWSKGLKTGIYYLRTKPAANAIQFTIDQSAVCESCSS